MGNGHYPRFHIYVNEEENATTFNIHLDQKQASYEGTSAHSGECDGEIVEQEVQRLKGFLRSSGLIKKKPNSNAPSNDPRSRRFSDILRNS